MIEYLKQNSFMGNSAFIFIILILALSICVCMLLILIIKYIKERKKYNKEIELMEKYMKDQEIYINKQIKQNDSLRGFKHDISIHMQVISGLINEKKYEEAQQYIYKINSDFLVLPVNKYTGINVLDIIIDEKVNYMKKNNIEFQWEGKLYSIIFERVNIYDLCTIISNILDNGIEACQKLKKDKKISMCLKATDKKIYIMEKNVKTDKVLFDDKGILKTTKDDKNNHGIGSRNIRNAVEKYDGILRYKVNEDFFCIEIIM